MLNLLSMYNFSISLYKNAKIFVCFPFILNCIYTLTTCSKLPAVESSKWAKALTHRTFSDFFIVEIRAKQVVQDTTDPAPPR